MNKKQKTTIRFALILGFLCGIGVGIIIGANI